MTLLFQHLEYAMSEGTLERLQQRLAITPFAAWMGLKLESVDDHGVTMRLTMRPELRGSPSTRALHGGVTASLIDTASSYAVMALTGRSVATIDMRIDYHRLGNADEYCIAGCIVRLGRTLATADAQVLDSQGTLVASGRAVFLNVDR